MNVSEIRDSAIVRGAIDCACGTEFRTMSEPLPYCIAFGWLEAQALGFVPRDLSGAMLGDLAAGWLNYRRGALLAALSAPNVSHMD